MCVTTAVITELFFFVKNYLCVYLVTALCSVFAEWGGGEKECKAVKMLVNEVVSERDEERERGKRTMKPRREGRSELLSPERR